MKIYNVGAQKNRLNETVLLGTHNVYLGWVTKGNSEMTKNHARLSSSPNVSDNHLKHYKSMHK